ncbi:MAG: YciI family protein [Sulfuricella sp.]|nr:YciI family protein [Sulfuricella sp.]
MQFMMIVKASKDSEAGVLPGKELFAAMGKFNEEMAKAGVLLAAEGLQPSSKGVRIKFSGTKRTAVGGPFPETKELIAGYWMIQAKSLEEAIEWGMRCPNPMGEGMESEIEIRPVYEASDFPPDLFPPEEAAREQRLREEMAKKASKP